MAHSSIDYSLVLADLKAKRAQLDAAIAAIETMLGMQGPTAPRTNGPAVGGSSADMGAGAFLGMKIVDAVVKLLTTRHKALKTEDIVAELRNGGMIFSGDTPTNTVGSVLNRDFKSGGEIVSVGRGTWALAEWHPRLRRQPPKAVPTEPAPSAVPVLTEPEPAKEAEPAREDDGDDKIGLPAATIARTPLKPKKTVDDFDDDIPF